MRQFKFRYVNEIAGIFVFSSFLLLAIIAGAAGYLQGWFEPRVEFYTLFSTKDGTFGLQKGGEVRILSTLAGTVNAIIPDEKGGIEAWFEIKRAFNKFVRSDSYVVVKKKFGVAGDSYLEIIPGDPKNEILETSSCLRSVKEPEVMETVKEVMKDLQTSFKPVMAKLPETLNQLNLTFHEAEKFFKELRGAALPPLDKFDKFMNDVPRLVGLLHATLNDADTLFNGLTKDSLPAIKDFGVMIGDLRKIVLNIQKFIEKLQTQQMESFLNELPEVSIRLEQTLTEADKLMEGLQKHWLLKKYIDQNADSNKIFSPDEIGLTDAKK